MRVQATRQAHTRARTSTWHTQCSAAHVSRYVDVQRSTVFHLWRRCAAPPVRLARPVAGKSVVPELAERQTMLSLCSVQLGVAWAALCSC